MNYYCIPFGRCNEQRRPGATISLPMISRYLSASLLAVGLVLLSTAAQAQTTISIGPSVGLNVATGHFPDDVPYERTFQYRPGVAAGVLATISLGHFAVQPALLYMQQGFRSRSVLEYPPATGFPARITVDDNTRMDYLTIPLNATYSQHADGQGLQVFAGPYIGFVLGGRSKIKATDGTTVDEVNLPVAGVKYAQRGGDRVYVRKTDAGVQAGLGYRRGSVLVQGTYSLGLRNIAVNYDSTVNPTITELPGQYNRSFQVALSYLFALKH
jgi:hypothetical protein